MYCVLLTDTYGQQTVGALTLDHSGGRLVSGSRDNTVTIWDFHSMDQRLRPFKVFEPVEGNPVCPLANSWVAQCTHTHLKKITDIQFGLTGDRFLLVTPEHRARLYSRDGVELGQFAKGDPYIRDPKRTTYDNYYITEARSHTLPVFEQRTHGCTHTRSLAST